jgi:LPS O-antigen subunit length determinant protein (WzzB/FepE family)
MDTAAKSLGSEAEVDLRVIVARLWTKRWWIVLSVILFTAAFTAASFLMTPIYRATTVVVDANSGRGGVGTLTSALGQLGGLASIAGIEVNSGTSQTAEPLAVLHSREFTEGFIRDERLMPELFYKRWDSRTGQWKGNEEDWPTLAQAFKYFDKQVRSVSRDRVTGLISVQIEWRDRIKAALWSNALVERLNAEMRSRASASTTASLGYLQKELAATSEVETRHAIGRLIETQINQRMLANVTTEYAFRVVDRALPPDTRDVAKPNKLLLLMMGPTLGLIFGAFAVLVVGAMSMRGNDAR